jgi:hypothetical protein
MPRGYLPSMTFRASGRPRRVIPSRRDLTPEELAGRARPGRRGWRRRDPGGGARVRRGPDRARGRGRRAARGPRLGVRRRPAHRRAGPAGRPRRLEAEREARAEERRLWSYQLAVERRRLAVSQVEVKVYSGALREVAPRGERLPLPALLARVQVEQQAQNIDKPLPPLDEWRARRPVSRSRGGGEPQAAAGGGSGDPPSLPPERTRSSSSSPPSRSISRWMDSGVRPKPTTTTYGKSA